MKYSASYNFLFSPDLLTPPPREGSHEENLHCAESMTSRFGLASFLVLALHSPWSWTGWDAIPIWGFPFMMAMAQACSLHDQDLFQPATLGKEEGKSLAETQHSSPGEHRLSFPTYPIS